MGTYGSCLLLTTKSLKSSLLEACAHRLVSQESIQLLPAHLGLGDHVRVSQAPLGRQSSTISIASPPCCWGEAHKACCLSQFHSGSEAQLFFVTGAPKLFKGMPQQWAPRQRTLSRKQYLSVLWFFSLMDIIVERMGKLSWTENIFFKNHYSVLKPSESRLLQLRTPFISRQLFLLSFQRPILILRELPIYLPRSHPSGGKEIDKRQRWTGGKMRQLIHQHHIFLHKHKGKYRSGSDQFLDISSMLITVSSLSPCYLYSLTRTIYIIWGAQHKIKMQGPLFRNYC